ncbi:MAG: hypothetical protein IJI46_00635 [Erysipelotrichaceae bacterium]|nr:hypothetical protein [Erysipelotrichaceae bacterium]
MLHNRFLIIDFYTPEGRFYCEEIRGDLDLFHAGCIFSFLIGADEDQCFAFLRDERYYVMEALYLEGKEDLKKMNEYRLEDLGRDFEFLYGDDRHYRCHVIGHRNSLNNELIVNSEDSRPFKRYGGWLYERKRPRLDQKKLLSYLNTFLNRQQFFGFEMKLEKIDEEELVPYNREQLFKEPYERLRKDGKLEMLKKNKEDPKLLKKKYSG